jgi:ATP-dependent DNA ligase
VTANVGISPQLCLDPGRGAILPSGDDWVMEPKIDGWRFLFEVGDDHVRAFGGRNGRDHTGDAPEVEAWLKEHLPAGTILDGELVTQGHGPAVSSGIADGQAGRLAFVAFDVLRASGMDVKGYPWHTRRKMLETLLPVPVGPVQLMPVYSPDEELFQEWLKRGLEGAVVKRKNSLYRCGRRTKDWQKFKPQTTAEAVIIGWKYGVGIGNRDRCAALLFRMLDSEAESSCGYSASPKEADALVGHTFEMLHHGLFPSGKPRHPVFWRMRPDRD